MADPFDFESFWDDLRATGKQPEPPDEILIVGGKGTDLTGVLQSACEKAAHDLSVKYQERQGEILTLEVLADIVTTGVRIFMEKWHDGLREQNLAGLIEFVLEGQSLTPEEMTGFVRALPMSLLGRISESAIGSATGIHGLMAVEYARRRGDVRSYILEAEEGKVIVEFINRQDQRVRFSLNEEFKLVTNDPDSGVSTEGSDSAPNE
jgi:hypothetical protein